jgi:hypothetical protein
LVSFSKAAPSPALPLPGRRIPSQLVDSHKKVKTRVGWLGRIL